MEKIDEMENCFDSDEEDANDRPQISSNAGFKIKDLLSNEGVILNWEGGEQDKNMKPNFYIDEEMLKYFNPECVDGGDSQSDLESGEENNESNNADLSPFEKLATKMTDISGDGGVLKKIIKPGTADITENALVTLHYNAFLEYGDEPFDSSRLREKPVTFRLNNGGVLLGLQVAVASMQLGEVSHYLFGYKYGYGKMGCPPRIPAESTILYEVEILDFTNYSISIDDSKFSTEELKEMGYEKLMGAITSEHLLGNDLFKKNNVSRAAARYRKASRLLEHVTMENNEQEQRYKKMMVKVSLNLALCMIKMNKPIGAQTQCNNVLNIDSKNVKALYRKGTAKMMLDDFEQAQSYLLRAKRLAPSNVDIVNSLVELDEKMKEYERKEKAFCAAMFKPAVSVSGSVPRPPSSVATFGSEHRDSELSDIKEMSSEAGESILVPDGVSEDFAFMVRKKLEELHDDDSDTKLRFPGRCSTQEMAYIGSIAYLYSMKVCNDGESLLITKK